MDKTTSKKTAPFYVTTSIPFVNARPHVGFAFEAVLADVLARHRRLCGSAVRLQSGTDDNSLKNVRAAEAAGIATEALVARHAADFAALATDLELGYDDFVRTSLDPRHRAGVAALWTACARAGDLYRKSYRGQYCVGCECYYTDAELPGGRCPEHGTVPELVSEENWFFRLGRHRDALVELIASDRLRVTPASRRNEVLGFLAGGLEDISVSRSRSRARGWGIAVPDDPEQVVYVWFDALGNYVHGLDWAADGPSYRRFWAGDGRRVHVIGKGILRFHAVYWPAILLSAGLPLPTDLLVHGYLTVDGQKIGKSLGNAIDPAALAQSHGTDAVRHYLLRHVRPFDDADFSEARLRTAHDTELADQLGNLVRRTIALVQRHLGGRVPPPGEAPTGPLPALLAALPGTIDAALEKFATHDAYAAIFAVVAATNRYLEETTPWQLAKLRAGPDHAAGAARTRLVEVLQTAAEAIRIVGIALAPFLPATSAAIAAQLGHPPVAAGSWPGQLRWGAGTWTEPVAGGPVLFAKQCAGTHPR